MATTKAALQGLLDVLEGALGPGRVGGPLADVFERYDGEPAAAVEEHVVDLHGKAGASVLVGYLSEELTPADESGRPLAGALTPSVLLVRRRDGQGRQGADAEALDELYDAAIAALRTGGSRVAPKSGRALAGEERDWFGRALLVELPRSLSLT